MPAIAIVGSREGVPYQLVYELVEKLATKYNGNLTIVSGGARGVDRHAENAARRFRVPTLIYNAEWEKYGKRAGFLRNEQIVDASDEVYAFWNGESRGTEHTINLARKAGKLALVKRIR
jgi:hypothetical protein